MNRSSPFGRYEVLDRISAGGMAEVFRAKDTKRGGFVALKKLLPQVAEDEEFIEMFEDEARIVSQLEHPHIARNLDYGRIDGAYFIAFEYVHGRDLRKVYDLCVRQQRRLPVPFLIYVFARIGEGLAYAHARKGGVSNLVHRDVSPQNIVVSFDGDVKLIDFGIARAAGKLSRTQAGTIKGKFGYMSPEQVRGADIDQRTDVFSLGICLWEMLTLKRLFQAENELLVLEKIRNQVIEPPSKHNPEVPAEVDRIVLKALAKNIDERYRSAKEFYRDLNVFAQSTGVGATREDIARTMRSLFPDASTIEVTSSGIRVGPPPAAGAGPVGPPRSQETATMAADNKGSDLDIFEGLGKKSAAPQPSVPAGPRTAPVPGGPSRPPAPPGDAGKKTLLGIASPANPPPPVVPPPRQSGAPAGTPSTKGMPAVVPPPKASPAPPQTRPAPYNAAGGGMDMDWDDEDEATHIFDKDEKPEGAPAGPVSARPAAGLAPPPPPPGPASMSRPPNQGPPPPPPGTVPGGFGTPPPPAPSSIGGSLARASGTSGAPGPLPPPTINPMMGQTMPLAPPPPPGASGLPPRPASVPPPGMQQPMMQQPQMGMQQPMMQQPQMGMQQPMMQQPRMGMQPQNMGMAPTMPQPMQPIGMPPGMQQPMPQGGPGQPTMPPQHVAHGQEQRRMEATQLVRPSGGGGKIALVLVLLLVVLGIAGAAGAFFLMPRNGRILVHVTDAKGGAVGRAEVFIDGKKQCEVVPCTVDAVAAGSHDVKVLADGYDPASQSVTVESKKDATVDVKLSGGAAKGTGLRVSSTQPGVKLFVDGDEVGPLPQELRTLTPGDHKLRLVGSDRYAPLEKNVTVVKDEVQDVGSVTLKVVKGKATIALGTPGARVTLVSGTDRRDLPTFPISIDIDTSKTWTLEATKFGFQDYRQPISFEDGVAEKMFTVTLDPKGAAPSFPTGPVVTAKPPTTATPPTTAVTTAKPPTTAAPASGEATVTLNSVPPSKVVLDGKPLGDTPQKDIKVSAGDHKVIFINSDQDLKKTVPFSVKAGETKVVIGKLRD